MMRKDFGSTGKAVIGGATDLNNSPYPSKQASPHYYVFPSRFAGVIPLKDDNWGCQIYVNGQCIWLGTFKSEKEAAMAYDSAALKFGNGNCPRNFPFNMVTVEEPNFQIFFSAEAVLNMIRDGTYQQAFVDFLRTCTGKLEVDLNLNITKTNNLILTCEDLFEKELTPSDVGKLNRLVIPKRCALKHFPMICEAMAKSGVDEMQLSFYDKAMKVWNFRYCYWNSSQSYVFTKGWSLFVREKQLKTNDVISFCVCEWRDNSKVTKSYYMIDVKNGGNSNRLLDLGNGGMEQQSDVAQRSGQDQDHVEEIENDDAEGDGSMDAEEEPKPEPRTEDAGPIPKGFRLFGADIIC